MSKKPNRRDLTIPNVTSAVGIKGLRPASALLDKPIAPRVPSGASDHVVVGKHVVEFTLGVDPQHLINKFIVQVGCAALRQFLSRVVAEREVALALTHVARKGQTYPIQRLRRAAETARQWSLFGTQERETLYVATFVRGIQELLAPQIVGNSCTSSEQMHTVADSALHRLDDEAPRQAWLLRLVLGWGNEDEIDAIYIPRIHHIVNRALFSVGLINQPMSLS